MQDYKKRFLMGIYYAANNALVIGLIKSCCYFFMIFSVCGNPANAFPIIWVISKPLGIHSLIA
jgi:hypothetical protein